MFDASTATKEEIKKKIKEIWEDEDMSEEKKADIIYAIKSGEYFDY